MADFLSYHLRDVEEHLKHTDLVIDPVTKIPSLKYNSYTVIQYGPDKATPYEHLGFFFQLSKETKRPYESLVKLFLDHFKEISKDIYTPPEIPPVEVVQPKVRKRTKK